MIQSFCLLLSVFVYHDVADWQRAVQFLVFVEPSAISLRTVHEIVKLGVVSAIGATLACSI